MDKRTNHEDLHLDARLRGVAGDRPEFSASLYDRILVAVDAAAAEAAQPVKVLADSSAAHPASIWRSSKLLTLAASIALLVTGGWLAVSDRGVAPSPKESLFVSTDAALIERANAGAEHWELLGEDAEVAAQWLLGDLSLVFDSADDLAADEPSDAEREFGNSELGG